MSWVNRLFSNNIAEHEIRSLYGMSPPDPEAVARREKQVAKVKKVMGDKYRLARPVEKQTVEV